MYQSQFGLNRRPFSNTPDPTCVVPVGGMPEAISELEHCARDGQGIGILTAPAGLGKTILCRKLAEGLRDQFAVVFLPNANFPTRRSLLQAILYEMGHPYLRLGEQELRLEFASAVRDLPPDRAGLVVIVDEAHLLHNRLLEELRNATHLVHEGEMLVRLILSGQLELEERLVKKDLSAINQRIVCHGTLSSLTMLESEEYLQQRVEWAGGTLSDIFAADAARMICQASDGNPRCLNQLSDHGLLLASSGGDDRVKTTHVLEALDELKQLPLHWNHVEAPRSTGHTVANVVEILSDSDEETSAESHTTCIEFGAFEEEAPQCEEVTPADLDQTDLDQTQADEDIEISWDEAVVEPILESEEETSVEEIFDEVLDRESVIEVMEEDAELVDVQEAESITEEIQTVAEHVFDEEEVVVDHYAQLDQGLNPETVQRDYRCISDCDPVAELREEEDAFAVPPSSSKLPDLTVINTLPQAGEEWQPEDIQEAKRPALNSDPSDLIDQVIPLIEAALGNTKSKPVAKSADAKEPEDSDPLVIPDSLTEQILIEISTGSDSPSSGLSDDLARMIDKLSARELDDEPEKSREYFLLTRSGDSSADLEEQIAQTVLDTYADVQPLMWNSTTETELETEPETDADPLPRGAGEEPIRDPGDATPFEELRITLQQAVNDTQPASEPVQESTGPSLAESRNPAPQSANLKYDIVLPETDEESTSNSSVSRTDVPRSDDLGDQSKRRSYNNLFSKIRRKEQA